MTQPLTRFRWLGPVIIALAAAALTAVSWRCWPDVLVDFGREAYTAWRLSEGDVLYRDIAWFNGPLSAYWNALWFFLFGPSLTVLFTVNLVLLALFLALVYRMILDLSDPLTATVAGLAMVTLLAFNNTTGISNYTFLAPYSHEATHGLMCGMASVAFFGRWTRTRARRWLVLAGVFSGLALLTKLEMAIAALFAPLIGLAFSHRFAGGDGSPARALVPFVTGVLAVLLCAFSALWAHSGPNVAWQAVTAPWTGLFEREVMALPFYRAGMGFDDIPLRLSELAIWTTGWVLALACAVAVALLMNSKAWRSWRLRPALFGELFAAVLLTASFWFELQWANFFRPLPVVALATTAIAFCWRARTLAALAVFALAVYAMAVASKMLLQARVFHYGFVLAVPALLLSVVAVVHWIPLWVERLGGRGELVRAAALGLILVPCLFYQGISINKLFLKNNQVGTGADAFMADFRGPLVQQALRELSRAPAGQSLTVLPEGAMINYLARRRNPTPYIHFVPPGVLMFGEQNMLDAFKADPPDLIAIVHQDTAEFGPRFFGRDYAQMLMGWIVENYELKHLIGDPPLSPGATFGIAILVRKSAR